MYQKGISPFGITCSERVLLILRVGVVYWVWVWFLGVGVTLGIVHPCRL